MRSSNLYLLSLLLSGTAQAASSAVPISKSLISLSIEFCYILDYLGDVKAPNNLSKRLLQNIQDLGGSTVIRVGGDTGDATYYCDDCKDTLVNVFHSGATEASKVIYNKNLFSVLNDNVPSKQQIIFGLNLKHDVESVAQAEVVAAQKYLLRSRLLSYELGNEPDDYSSSVRSPWNVEVYASQIISWIQTIQKKTKTTHGWQVGALARAPSASKTFPIATLNRLGVPAKIHHVSSYSYHAYPFSVCGQAGPTLPQLMDHDNTVKYFKKFIPSIQAAEAAGVDFNIGEAGSATCHGKKGVSNTFGAALWEIDYALNGAVLGMRNMFFHMGTGFWYAMWQPVEYKGIAAHVNPTYYSLILIASTIGNLKDPHVSAIASSVTNLVIYAIYPTESATQNTPIKLIILNLNHHAATTRSRSHLTVNVANILKSPSAKLKVSRLTAASADVTSGVTFGGLSWENEGKLSGHKVYENIPSSGKVNVFSSEAVVVEVS